MRQSRHQSLCSFRGARAEDRDYLSLCRIISFFSSFVKRFTIFFWKFVSLEVNRFPKIRSKRTISPKARAREEHEYFIATKKTYAKRYATDCFSDYYAKKAIECRRGIGDLPRYKTERASFEELKKQNSYFIKSLLGEEEEKEKE